MYQTMKNMSYKKITFIIYKIYLNITYNCKLNAVSILLSADSRSASCISKLSARRLKALPIFSLVKKSFSNLILSI